MDRIIISDAARDYDESSDWYLTGGATTVLETAKRVATEGEIIEGPFEGDILRMVLVGEFGRNKALVDSWTWSVSGEKHLRFVFDEPWDLGSFEDPFADGVEVTGNRYDNRFSGSGATDILTGNGGDDVLRGLGGADRIDGGSGGDRLFGDGGNDRLVGGGGDDILTGGAGNDWLRGGNNDYDVMRGGSGDDTYIADGSNRYTDDIVEKKGAGYDVLISKSQGETLPDHVEELRMVRDYDNTVNAIGNAQDNLIIGTNGVDWISGLGGKNELRGRGGDDFLLGGDRRDLLLGGNGDDTLHGGAGSDVLDSGRNDDFVDGERGRDSLTGGAGADTFWFDEVADSSVRRPDTIEDFESGIDLIDLRYVDAVDDTEEVEPFTFIGAGGFSGEAGELRFANGRLSGDVDGDGSADFQILVDASILEADLILV